MSEYTVGSGSELKRIYDAQVFYDTRKVYVWEYRVCGDIWNECLINDTPCSPNWSYDTVYRFKSKVPQIDPKDKVISDQADEIITLKEKIEELRSDYKKMVEQNMGLIIDLAPTLTDDQLRMVGGRTGSWFVVIEQTKPVYIVRYDPRTGN